MAISPNITETVYLLIYFFNLGKLGYLEINITDKIEINSAIIPPSDLVEMNINKYKIKIKKDISFNFASDFCIIFPSKRIIKGPRYRAK